MRLAGLLLTGLVALAVFAALLLPATADSGHTFRVSVASDGTQANKMSYFPAISRDGWLVAFVSEATNLVPDDTNADEDVFLHDRHTGVTERVSVASDGAQANLDSGFWYGIAISRDWRYVAFASEATNLVPGDANGARDVFVHDRLTGTTELVSVDGAGNQANGNSGGVAMSDDGRYVAFVSYASNLVPGDTNGREDIFVHDRQTGATERVSVDSAGNQADNESGWVQWPIAISADGRYVVFDSYATNLVPGDTNGTSDVFVHDRQTGVTERVSVDSAGNEANGWSDLEAINGDGRYVAFLSEASNLVPDDTNDALDVFVHDRQTGVTERVSVDSAGNEANGDSVSPAISIDARYVSFWSGASNLVPDDTNDAYDVFVHDRQTGVTERVSVDSAGNQGNDHSGASWVGIGVTADGRYVAFESSASNLVAGDTNGEMDIFIRNRKPIDAVDTDSDGAFDFLDPCPANPDCDGDGFLDGSELTMGTLPLVACAATPTDGDERFGTWPPDWDDSQTVDLMDLLPLKPHFNTTYPDPPYDVRYDLNTDDTINLLDLLPFKPFFNTSCQ